MGGRRRMVAVEIVDWKGGLDVDEEMRRRLRRGLLLDWESVRLLHIWTNDVEED